MVDQKVDWLVQAMAASMVSLLAEMSVFGRVAMWAVKLVATMAVMKVAMMDEWRAD